MNILLFTKNIFQKFVNYNKIKHMKKAINYYLLKRKISNIDIRIDAVGVLINKNKCIIQHIKDAIQS